MTLKQLTDIYAGRRTTWPDGTRMRLIIRPSTDSDTGVLRAMSPDMNEAVSMALTQKGLIFPQTDQAAADLIARTPGGLGSSTLALLITERRSLISLPIEGVMPRDASYKYLKPLYLICTLNPTAAVLRLKDFILSAAGREILVQAGYRLIDPK